MGGTGVVHDGLELAVQIVRELVFAAAGFGFRLCAVLLNLAELVQGAVEDAGGVGSCSFDGADLLFEGGVEERVGITLCGDVTVNQVAAAKSPGGAGDFGGEAFFDGVVRQVAGVVHVEAELAVGFGFFGENEVGLSVEAVFKAVAGGGGAAGFSARSC